MGDDWLDFWKSLLFGLCILALVPGTLAAASDSLQSALASPSKAEVEFKAYRLRHVDIGGNVYGSRSARVAWDAVSIGSDALRRSVIVPWDRLLGMDIEANLKASAGGVVIVLPKNYVSLAGAEKKKFLRFESLLEGFTTDQAVFLAEENDELLYLMSQVERTSGKSLSPAQQIFNSIIANSYSMSSVSSANPIAVPAKQFNVVATLSALDPKSPTILFVAHYDAAGIAPSLAQAADSNGSGVAAMLELLSIFRQFYSQDSRPKFNLKFVFTTGGKFNYQGSRYLADLYADKDELKLVVCLDSLAAGEALYMQVAKVPAAESTAGRLYERIKKHATKDHPVDVLHRKININADILPFEHEIFNIRKLPAVTFTHWKEPGHPLRNSLLDTIEAVNMDAFYSNTKLLANGILSFMYDVDDSLCVNAVEEGVDCSFAGKRGVNKDRLRYFLESVVRQPRHAEASETFSSFLMSLIEQYGIKPTKQLVKFQDVVVYNLMEDTISAYVTKPAVFEIVVAMMIAVYCYVFYVCALNGESMLTRYFLNKSS